MPRNIELYEELVEAEAQRQKNLLFKRINKALNELKSSSTQIFKIKDEKPEQIGSGFYLRHQERLFLVSAAHVFDDEPENERWVFNEEGNLQQITGVFYKHRAGGRRDDDLKDLIAIEVTDLSRKNKFESDMIDLRVDYEHGLYGFLGYPGTKNGPIPGKRVAKNRAYSYFDKSLEAKEITSFQYDDCLNILIRYQHNKTITNGVGPNKGPRMKGISGGPVFWISPIENLSSWNKHQIRLAGVVIHTLEKYQYMSAARLKILTDVLDGKPQFQDEFDCFQVEGQ